MSTTQHTQSKPIIFYDGDCGICNAFVDFLLKHDKKERLLFAPLQGITAKEHIPSKTLNSVDSVVLIDVDKKLYIKSKAALKTIAALGGFYKFSLGFLIFPTFIRDGVYDFVARNRHKWAEENGSCRLLTKSEKQRFLP
jgi:predicted DCC family thiol-disulfide oxidoreductase YuxK